jgi:hypothetical protein
LFILARRRLGKAVSLITELKHRKVFKSVAACVPAANAGEAT